MQNQEIEKPVRKTQKIVTVVFLVYAASNFLLFLSVGYFAGISLWLTSLFAAIPIAVSAGAAFIFLSERAPAPAGNALASKSVEETENSAAETEPAVQDYSLNETVALSDERLSSDPAVPGEMKTAFDGALSALAAAKLRNGLVLRELNRRAFDSRRNADGMGEVLAACDRVCAAVGENEGDKTDGADPEELLATLRATAEKLRNTAAETLNVADIDRAAGELGRRARLISVNAEVITKGRDEDIAAASLAAETEVLLRSSDQISADVAHLQTTVIDPIHQIERELSEILPRIEEAVELLCQREREIAEAARPFRELRSSFDLAADRPKGEASSGDPEFLLTTKLISELEIQSADLEKIECELSEWTGRTGSAIPETAVSSACDDGDVDILETGPPLTFYREPVQGSGQDILEL